MENRPARDLMVAPVVTATPDTSVSELADLLSLVITSSVCRSVSNGKLVGIVSRADVVRAIARTPDAIAEAL